VIIAALTAEAAMRLAQRSDRPTDLGPATNPQRAAQGWRRWGWDAAPAPRSTSHDEVLAKVRKLLALAGNGAATEGEATNAAAAAQRLIAQHRLDVALLDDSATVADSKPEPASGNHEPLERGKKAVHWRGILAEGVAVANGCQVYWNHGNLMIVGAPSDVASVRHLYGWLAREIDRLGADAALGRGRSYGRSWRMGCASRVVERIAEAAAVGKAEARAAAIEAGVALARVDGAIAKVDARMRATEAWLSRHVRLKRATAAPVNGDALRDGRAAGDRIKLSGHTALGRGDAGRLGGGS
jgi:hypothetical protein